MIIVARASGFAYGDKHNPEGDTSVQTPAQLVIVSRASSVATVRYEFIGFLYPIEYHLISSSRGNFGSNATVRYFTVETRIFGEYRHGFRCGGVTPPPLIVSKCVNFI